MEETIEFYGFRGNIIFSNQITLFSMGLENNSKDKNQVFTNFFKELKRVTWPTKKSNYKYFLWVFVFVVFLVLLFALVSWGATELIKLMGAN